MESGLRGARGTPMEEACLRQLEGARARESRRPGGSEAARAALASELDLHDAVLLDRLLALGIRAELAPAFESLPLVRVAWADDEVDPEERWRVLEAATRFGLELGRPAHAQLELWLKRPPSGELLRAWDAFARLVLTRPAAASRARCVREGSLAVAEAAGGLLGIGAVSGAERNAIEDIHHALSAVDHGAPETREVA